MDVPSKQRVWIMQVNRGRGIIFVTFLLIVSAQLSDIPYLQLA